MKFILTSESFHPWKWVLTHSRASMKFIRNHKVFHTTIRCRHIRTFIIPRMVLVLTRSAAQHEIVGGSLWNEIVGVHYRGDVFFDSTVATRPAVSDWNRHENTRKSVWKCTTISKKWQAVNAGVRRVVVIKVWNQIRMNMDMVWNDCIASKKLDVK